MTKFNVSFVFPMYNESANVKATINRISRFAKDVCGDYEIIMVDDASTDSTADTVMKIAASDDHVRLIRLEVNTKFGGALSAGLKSAVKETVLYTDSDFPAKEEDLRKALELSEGSDIVTAYSLVLKDSSLKRIMMSKVYNFLVELFFGLKLRDINSGLKVYKREVLKDMLLISKSPFIDVEIFAEAVKRKFTIRQYGLIFDLRTQGKSAISRPKVVLRTFWDMLAYKFFRRSR